MSDTSLEHILAFNRQLSALSAAGVPLDLGDSSRSVNEVLQQADTNLQLRTSLGQPIGDALAEERQLPSVYRNAVQSGLLTEKPTVALDVLSRVSTVTDQLRSTLGQSLVQPLVLFTLAYFGFIALCSYFVPTVEGVYDQLQYKKHWGLEVLAAAQRTRNIWIPVIPLLTIAIVWLWRHRTAHNRLGMLSGKHVETQMQHSNFASQLAMLLQEVAEPEALRIAGGTSGNETLQETANSLADAAEKKVKLPFDDERLQSLPPLLRWILVGELGEHSQEEMLRFASDMYRQQAERRLAFWQVAWPVVIGAALGGAVVLIYGWCLFSPYAHLLRDI